MTTPLVLSALLREDLTSFIHKAVGTIIPETKYQPNWHIEAITYLLGLVTKGSHRRLIINQPPRSLKSITVSVAYVAWLLGRDPSKTVIVVSYSKEFAAELHRQFRLVVDSDWYKQLFPDTVWSKETGLDCVTTKGGGRFATSIGGTLTGRGGDLIIVDDPLNANEAQSEPARKAVLDFFTGSLVSRLNDKEKGAIIVVMQRLHEDDLAGYLLEQGGWHHLNLPAIATRDEEIPIGRGRVHRRLIGEVLHAARESADTLEQIKREIGSLMFSAQYQQAPVPIEGNIFLRKWIRPYDQLPQKKYPDRIVQSWDIATATGSNNDFSACTTWLSTPDEVFLIDIWRGRLQFPALRRHLIGLAERFSAETILIEEAGPGIPLLQDLISNTPRTIARPIGVKPDGDKRDRMAAQAAKFEAGLVRFPKDHPALGEYLLELLGFPATRHDDQVDSTSQFLGWWWDWRGRMQIVHVAPIIIEIPRVDRWAYR